MFTAQVNAAPEAAEKSVACRIPAMARSSVPPSVPLRARSLLCFLRHNRRVARVAVALLVVALALVPAAAQPPASRTVILSTTTSTQDSGLLDVLVPMFEQQTGFTLKTVPVGTGQALALAARGEADVVLVHAPPLEGKYVEEGKLTKRRLVMVNDFVVVGPESDPARIRGEKRAADALAKIAAAGVRFV